MIVQGSSLAGPAPPGYGQRGGCEPQRHSSGACTARIVGNHRLIEDTPRQRCDLSRRHHAYPAGKTHPRS